MQNGNAEQFQVMAAALSDLQVGMDVLSLDVQDIKESMGLAVPAMHPAWVNRGGVKESPRKPWRGTRRPQRRSWRRPSANGCARSR